MQAMIVLYLVTGLISALPPLYALGIREKLWNARYVVPDALEPKVYDLWRGTAQAGLRLLTLWAAAVAALVAVQIAAAGRPEALAYAITAAALFGTLAAYARACAAPLRTLRHAAAQGYGQATDGRDLRDDHRFLTHISDAPRLNA